MCWYCSIELENVLAAFHVLAADFKLLIAVPTKAVDAAFVLLFSAVCVGTVIELVKPLAALHVLAASRF